jgi:hypothetical protein
MSNQMLSLLRSLARALAAWPRRHVLRDTGEPVDLLAVRDDDGRRFCLVELRGGRRIEVAEAELTSQLALNGLAVAICTAVALAGLAAGGAVGLSRAERILVDVASCAQAAGALNREDSTR